MKNFKPATQQDYNLTLQKFFTIVKYSLILLFIIGLQISATGYSQSGISLNAEAMTIRETLKQIEKQTDYHFFYSDDLMFLDRTAKLTAINSSINEVLDQLFETSDLGYRIYGNNTVIVSIKERLQGITVTGKVIDASGNPMPGVNVVIKGTSTGVVTDLNGAYSLQLSDDNVTLSFSFIGYVTQEIAVGDRRSINVTLTEDTREIEEVVIVGYGSMKKENLTGAVAQLKGETFENRPVQYISQALQGQVANLNILANTSAGGEPGATPNINIRGYTGLGTMGAPLIIIDGVQGGDINSVNMNDVESVSVLKDAASSAIYGSSAPFGVIIINTKKGGRDKRPTITYNNYFGIGQVINMPLKANGYDFVNIWNEASVNAGVSPPFSDENVQLVKDVVDGKIPPFVLQPDSRPGTDAWDMGLQWGDTDWYDFYFKKSTFQQQHNIGVSGGSEKSSYYLGVGYSDQDGVFNFAEENSKQYRVRANLSADVTKWLTAGFRGNFSRRIYDRPSDMGNLSVLNISRKWPNWATQTSIGTWGLSSVVTPIIDGGRNVTETDWATLTGEFVIKPLPGWDITGNYTYNGNYSDQLIHYRTTYQTMPSGALTVWSNSNNKVERAYSKKQHHAVNLFSSFEKKIGDHYFNLLLGYTQELYDDLGVTASNLNLYSNDIPSLTLTYNPTRSVSDDANQLAIRGGFGRITYNYKEKYLVEFNGRYDGTSRFLEDVRMKFYPGVSAAWVASKETFWEPLQSYVNFLKVRASYGQLGDQSFTGRYTFYPSMGTIPPTDVVNNWYFSDGRQSYVSNAGIINQRLTWITTSTLDFGVDLTFFNQRLNVNFDWYRRFADDFVGPAEVLPSLLGASQPQVNNSAMETKGVDLTIGWNDHILNKEFHYYVNLVFSDFKSKITKFPNPTGLITTWYEGQMIGDIWGYETHGLFQSQAEITAAPKQTQFHSNWTPGDVRYVDRNGDDAVTRGNNTLEDPGDQTIIGSTAPRFSFGLTLGADYKGFDFSVFFQGVGKRDYWTESNLFWGINQGGIYNTSWQTFNQNDRWTPETPDGFFPKYYHSSQMTKNMQVSDRYLINAAYVRIKNLQLGYTIPADITGKIGCRRARIFMSVENLATFTGMIKSFDPEFITDAGRGGGQIYPFQRTWAFGLNVTF